MKLVAELVFLSLGKIDRRLVITDPGRHIYAPLIGQNASPILSLLESDLPSLSHYIQVMEFAFNGRQYPENFVIDGLGGITPETMVFEYEFVGFRVKN